MILEEGPEGTVYCLHLSVPYRHAKHYLGWAPNGRLEARLAEHGTERGARLLQVVAAAGITWVLARTWPGRRGRERSIKNQGGAARVCPICRAIKRDLRRKRCAGKRLYTG